MKRAETGGTETRSLYEFGEFRLDANRRLLFRSDGSPVPVTSRVFDTLLQLVLHAGQLVDKRELMRAVWGDAVVEENNLTQAVSALRQLLGERPDEHRYIVTVPGRGYRFIASVRTADQDASKASASMADSDAAVRAGDMPPLKRLHPAWWLAVIAVAAGIGLLLIYARRDTQSTDVIAILPFKPLVAATADPALELGMADTLITRLSRGTTLIVRPLSSVRRFGELDQDPVEAGRALGADVVLDGSIHRDGEAFRVNARLVRVRDGAALWADQIDQASSDVFAAQDRIADRVVGALALKLTPSEQSQLARRDTQSGEAYRLYTLGRFHFFKLVPAEIEKAIEYFRQAIAADPGYAAAYAALAECYRARAITSDLRPADVLPVAKQAAMKAIELDPNLDSAVASLCFTETWWDWDWKAAEASCKRALAIQPDSADGLRAYAVLLSDLARHDEAVAMARRAVEVEPLSLITRAIESHVLHYAGRNAEALESLRAALELDERFWIARLFLGKVLLARGDLPGAMAEFERAREFSGANSETISMIGYTAARMGDEERARKALGELLARPPSRYVPPFNVAMIYNGLGDRERTFEWLEKAYEDRDVRLTFLKVERKWDPLREDPRFQSLQERLGLQ